MIRWIALFLILTTQNIFAQPVQQTGHVTPGHVPMWTTNGVIQDGGTAFQGFLTSIGVTASGPSICANSGPVTGPYNEICIGATQTGGGTLSMFNYGGATGGLNFAVNGSPQSIAVVSAPLYSVQYNLAGSLAGVLLGNGQILIGQTSAGPSAETITGDMTITNGGVTTVGKVNGVPFPSSYTANLPLVGNGTSLIGQGTRSGNTTDFVTGNGSYTNGHCISVDSAGNHVDAGGPCTTSGGGGTVTSGTANQLAYYSSTGATVVGLSSVINSCLETNGTGVPSWMACGVTTLTAGTTPTSGITSGNLIGVTSNKVVDSGVPFASIYQFPATVSIVGGAASAQGTGTKLQLSTGSPVSGDCTKFDSTGNTVDAGAGCGVAGSTIQVTPGAGSGGVSSSTALMMGLGAVCAITPNTARVHIGFNLTLQISGTVGRAQYGIHYGTGTAPSNGAATTGTLIGTNQSTDIAISGGFGAVTVTGNVIGLTPGTPIWIDIALGNGGVSGTTSVANSACDAFSY